MSTEDILQVQDKRTQFFIIDNCIFNYGLDVYAISVYSLLVSMSRNSSCYPSYNYILEKLNISRNKCISSIKNLENKKLINVKRTEGKWEYNSNGQKVYKNGVNIYQILNIATHEKLDPSASHDEPIPCNDRHSAPEGLKQDSLNNTKTNNINNSSFEIDIIKTFEKSFMIQIDIQMLFHSNNNTTLSKYTAFKKIIETLYNTDNDIFKTCLSEAVIASKDIISKSKNNVGIDLIKYTLLDNLSALCLKKQTSLSDIKIEYNETMSSITELYERFYYVEDKTKILKCVNDLYQDMITNKIRGASYKALLTDRLQYL